ncbi:MAG: hypothetical protein IBX71_07200 [Candidatus Desulforudis sp.]|nr:hypothetical protein [Desulforudis sp.]
MKRKATLKDAVDIFLDSPDMVSIYVIEKNGDYAVQVQEDEQLYLIFEVQGKGIVLGKLPPDLVRLRLIEDEDEHYRAGAFMRQRIKEAGLA